MSTQHRMSYAVLGAAVGFSLMAAIATAEVRLLVGATGALNTVRIFDRFSGDPLGEFTQGGVPGGPFGFEFGPDGDLYVSGFDTNAVYRYTHSGQPMGAFVSPGSGDLSSPYDLEFGPDGNLYVSDYDNSRILRYNGTTGAFMDEFVTAGSSGLDHPHELRFRGGYLYVSHWGHSILRYDAMTGAFVDAFVAPGSGGLMTPVGFDWGQDGLLYVVSQDSAQILRYDGQTGVFIDVFADLWNDWLGFPRWLAFSSGPDQVLFVSTGSGVAKYHWPTGQPIGHLLYESEVGDARYLMFAEVAGQDCNYNGTLDESDIASGASLDCNGNGIPDECEVGDVIPQGYILDDGTREVALGLTPAATLAWLNQFTVASNRETLAAIELSYGPAANGTPVTVYVWSDPNGDGSPADAAVLTSAAAVVANAGTDVYNTVDIPDVYVGPPGTSFFIGAVITHAPGEAPANLDQTSTHNRSWVAGDITLDPNNLGAAQLFGVVDTFGRPGNWTVRAPPAPPDVLMDCNGNGVPDDCDIAEGTSLDNNGNGVPDECEVLPLPGDLNCDGTVGFGDINPFVLYLSNYGNWLLTYPDCPPQNGDINGDGAYPSFGDINPFVALLTR